MGAEKFIQFGFCFRPGFDDDDDDDVKSNQQNRRHHGLV